MDEEPHDYKTPDWEKTNGGHEWKIFVGPRARAVWHELPEGTRLMIAADAADFNKAANESIEEDWPDSHYDLDEDRP